MYLSTKVVKFANGGAILVPFYKILKTDGKCNPEDGHLKNTGKFGNYFKVSI